MFLSVSYYDESAKGFKTGRTYTYKTEMALNAGDIVAAPVRNRANGALDDKKAIVVETNLEEPKFPCNEIVSLWTDDKGGGDKSV